MHAWNLIKRWTKYCWYNFEIEFNTASNCTFAATSSSLKVKPLVILDLGWKLWVYKKTLLSSLFLLCIFPLTFWNVSYWYTVHKLCIKVKQIPKTTIWRRRKKWLTFNCSFDFDWNPPLLIFTLVRTRAFWTVWGARGLGSFGWATNMIVCWGFPRFNQDQAGKGQNRQLSLF